MILEYTITIGSILQTVVYTAAAVAFFYAMRTDINILKHDMRNLQDNQKAMTEAFSQMGRVLTSIAVQDNRIIMLEKYIDELRHGKGLVQ
jgi:hypothetical protein